MAEGNGPQPVLWCRWCSQPARRAGAGDGPPGKVVHAETGLESGSDGHTIAPTTTDPEMTAAAKRVTGDYPEYLVTVPYGYLFRAELRGVLTPVPVEASAEQELRARLDQHRRIRALAAADAQARLAAAKRARS